MNPPDLPLQGQAAYEGDVGGVVRYRYGDSWSEALAGTLGLEEVTATVTLSADFAANTLSGCIGCAGDIVVRPSQLRQFLGDEALALQAMPTDYELHFGAVAFNPDDGTFESPDVTIRHPARTVTHAQGFWGGQFSTSRTRRAIPAWWRASATSCSRRPTAAAACSSASSMPSARRGRRGNSRACATMAPPSRWDVCGFLRREGRPPLFAHPGAATRRTKAGNLGGASGCFGSQRD